MTRAFERVHLGPTQEWAFLTKVQCQRDQFFLNFRWQFPKFRKKLIVKNNVPLLFHVPRPFLLGGNPSMLSNA